MSDPIRREDALRVTLAYSSSYSAEQAETAIRALPAMQPYADELVGHMTKLIAAGLDRIEQLTEERDAAYASGYSDAETEISKSALGQKNDFLHSQYDNAKLRIEALTVDRAEARAGWHKYEGAWMAAEGKLADVEALIEAQAKDHASNNIRFAEAEHRAKAAEADIAHLHKLLAEAASDLTAYVDAEYPPDTCAQYPDIAKRHFRDMDLVRRIEAELKGESHDQCA